MNKTSGLDFLRRVAEIVAPYKSFAELKAAEKQIKEQLELAEARSKK